MDVKLMCLYIAALYWARPATGKILSTALPETHLPCYQTPIRNLTMGPPLTIQLLVEIIRKVELENTLDMRLVSTSMLHGIRFDGIEKAAGFVETPYVVPYRATARQFTKYKLLVDHLTSGEKSLFPIDALSTLELCLLHKMISSTVFAGERGDETRTCPILRSLPYESDSKKVVSIAQNSACPEESGVIKTKWGSVSPGHIVAGVASALQLQNVRFANLVSSIEFAINDTDQVDVKFKTTTNGKTINNLWVATLAGDVAEAALYQGPYVERITLGNFGTWNDTYWPRAHYLAKSQSTRQDWDMTSAEMLGGIDGLVIASKVKEWTDILRSTRLSQLIEMYYSARGIGFDRRYRACQRKELLGNVLQTGDLNEQVSITAKALDLLKSVGEAHLAENVIDEVSQSAVTKFQEVYPQITDMYAACEIGRDMPRLEIIAVVDGSWTNYESNRLIAALADAVDVSYYGSKLGIINGNSGAWLSGITDSLVELFTNLGEPDKPWPSSLSLVNSLETIVRYYQNKSKDDCIQKLLRPLGQVVLFLTPTATISTTDMAKGINLIDSIKNVNPDISVGFVTSEFNSETYSLLTNNQYGNDFVIFTKNSIGEMVNDVADKLSEIPLQMINFNCDRMTGLFEDYITPGIVTKYQIHFDRLQKADVNIQFQTYDNGALLVCVHKDGDMKNKICNGIAETSVVEYRARDFCSSEYYCNVPFTVTMETSKLKCAEMDCRYPDQGRILIKSSWTFSSASKPLTSTYISVVIFTATLANFLCSTFNL